MTLIFSRLCTRYRGVQCHSCDVLNQVSRDAMSFIDPTKNQFARYFIPNFEGIKHGIYCTFENRYSSRETIFIFKLNTRNFSSCGRDGGEEMKQVTLSQVTN